MALKQETRTIGDVQFRIRQLPFSPSRRVLVRFSKAVAPGLAKILGSAPSLAQLKETTSLTEGIQELVDRVSDEDLEFFAEQFGKTTEFSQTGDKWPRLTAENRETVFAGNMLMFFQWLSACFEVNYADFLAVLGVRQERDPALQEEKAEQ